jgi:lipoate synthase
MPGSFRDCMRRSTDEEVAIYRQPDHGTTHWLDSLAQCNKTKQIRDCELKFRFITSVNRTDPHGRVAKDLGARFDALKDYAPGSCVGPVLDPRLW